MYRADLHCHSTCSDGTCTPNELLILAKEKGLSALSITDHDTIAAYTEPLFAESKKIGVKLLMGVEFSTRHKKFPVHILGYGYQKTEELLAFCDKHQERRKDRNRAILEKLKRLSIIVEESELGDPNDRTIGRPHIADILVKKRYVSSIQEAFDRYIGEKKPCFEPGVNFSPEETIEVIHEAEGKAFIAHPHLIKKGKVERELLDMDFDGIECYYGLFHSGQEKRWLQIAEEKRLLISGGSDFHGEINPHIPLGCSWVDEDKVKAIFGEM